MKIALCQINSTVGDLSGNAQRIIAAAARAREAGAVLAVFPELCLSGYPPQDLLLRPAFMDAVAAQLNQLASEILGVTALVGTPTTSQKRPGRPCYNSAALLRDGRVETLFHKRLLPTYDVFDEDRYFEPGNSPAFFELGGNKIGVTICEDIWNDGDFWRERRYSSDPLHDLASLGCSTIVNLSASPWHSGKEQLREQMIRCAATDENCSILLCNAVGGNDHLVFDGSSFAVSPSGTVIARSPSFEESVTVVDTECPTPAPEPTTIPEEMIYRALVLGTRDYLHKCGFSKAVLGLSGGIDSSLVAVIAADALGAENVLGVSLPAPVSSEGSLRDAEALARSLGIGYTVVPIHQPFESVCWSLSGVFAPYPTDVTEENIQSRLRGLTLMAISNKFKSLVLTTGNKSELAVGYCTIYGDMSGGLAVISDLPKTVVYQVCRWINREREIIPDSCISKPPSAELRENQTDQDSLPPYDILDSILHQYVEENKPVRDIIASGHDPATVHDVVRLVDLNEYKRQQAAPGLKITPRAFGRGRRMPMAQRFREGLPH